jgi:signal transduction histidine kinase
VRDVLGRGLLAQQIALLDFAEELFASLAAELSGHVADLRRLIDRIQSVAEIPRVVLGRQVLRMPQLIGLSTAVAIEVELTLLLAFANAKVVSLWTMGTDGTPHRVAQAGEDDLDARDTRPTAHMVLTSGSDRLGSEHHVSGVPVGRSSPPDAALVASGESGSSADRELLLEAAAPVLSAALTLDQLKSRKDGFGRSAPDATARALSRLRFDLHDGPQQDVVMLAEDLRFFRDQLAAVVDDRGSRDRVLGRIDDLQARLVALDGDLRRISALMQSPFMSSHPLPEAIAKLAEAFRERTAIEPQLTLQGRLTGLSDTQQITLLALIREALSNIREHSNAKHVTISLSAGAEGTRASIVDDGDGFDPEMTLVTAAREGHLGLVGMHERVRLLEGEMKISSRAGGPTVISVTLPAWPAVEPHGV